MRPFFIVTLLFASAACGNEIGDPCSLSSECSPQGDRICDVSSPGGYCTIFGCEHDTCPGEAVCVRFFSVADTNRGCNPDTEDISGGTDECTSDELCTLSGSCVPRTAEQRFCMKKCQSDGDCRDDYECRDEALMMDHGGEPVPEPGTAVGDDPQPFCAAAPI